MNAFRNLNRPVAQAFDKEIIKVEKFVITGGKPLHGEVTISGAKNAAVGILPATILAADVCVIENLPDISDVAVSLKILSTLGAQVKMLNRNTYEIDTTHLTGTNVPDDLSRQMRADRLGRGSDNLFIVCETSLENIMAHIEQLQPGIVVIDSIQTIASDDLEASAGSVSQVRECAARLLKYAKDTDVPVLLIGHITKEGSLAGPKVLEHIVDAVLQFEGDRQYMFRILRAIKNRFGNTAELGIYEMGQKGLREVTNPSELLLSAGDTDLSGVAVGVTVDGARPFLIEVQALVSTAAYGTPQRSVNGFDSKRANMLLAVLEKRVGFKLAAKDVFLNIAGGIRVSDPALDLPVICSILSSNFDIALGHDVCMTGEVGLSGEIRPVARIEQRIAEAEKLGMSRIIVPAGNLKGIDRSRFTIGIFEAARVTDAVKELFS